jgi:predicted RNA-binding Zn-ribbon protein involved in translation (DUF1610 family)
VPELSADSRYGYRYPIAEKYFGAQARDTLEEMANAGLLERHFYSKELSCPKCGSINVSMRFHCPKCDSTNIKRKKIIEHVVCGFVAPEEEFKEGKCPKCGRELKRMGVDYVEQGVQFQCQDCKDVFQTPVQKLYDPKDNESFLPLDAKEVSLFSYKVTTKLEEELQKALFQKDYISKKLTELGFAPTFPGTVKGKSGIVHEFFMTATAHIGFVKTKIVIDIMGNGRVSEEDILKLYARAVDSGAYGVLVVAVPSISPGARRVADTYGIAITEAPDFQAVGEALVKRFAELVETPEERMFKMFGT